VGFDCATPQFVQFVLSLNLAYAENSPQANSGIKVGATNTPTKTARQRSLSKLLERGGVQEGGGLESLEDCGGSVARGEVVPECQPV